jgi:magnesium-transporting ATPase (P-type)
VENSSFTGEPEPVELGLEKTDDEALHSKNLAFNSAMVVEGKGMGVVVRTGDHTMIGSIASLVGQTKAGKSTLEVRTTRPRASFSFSSSFSFLGWSRVGSCGGRRVVVSLGHARSLPSTLSDPIIKLHPTEPNRHTHCLSVCLCCVCPQAEVIGFVHFITIFAVISACVFYAIALIKTCALKSGGKCDPLGSFINVFIVVLIANVPEGLPATVTSCLTVCAQRLALRNVFVKRLDCVETLG